MGSELPKVLGNQIRFEQIFLNIINNARQVFTTKEAGKGTGLGLSISQKIIEAAGGRIDLQVETGEGSTFTVILSAL